MSEITETDRERAKSLIVAAGDAVPIIGQMGSMTLRDPSNNLHEFRHMKITNFYTTNIGGAEHIAIEVKHQKAEGISFSRIVRNMTNGGKGVQWCAEATSDRPEFKGMAQSWTAINVSYS